MTNPRNALLILNAVCGLGPVRAKRLIDHFGSGEAVLAASREALSAVGDIPEHAVSNLLNFDREKFLAQENDLLNRHQVQAITLEDPGYPAALKEIHDAPIVLYVKGQIAALNHFAVGIVGSRRASFYGMETARTFGQKLAAYGIPVVSGLARGIDTAAHQGALEGRGLTVAVLGSGLGDLYPAENKRLAEEIAKNGAVISEFPMATPPSSFNFPRRNRIISGLSRGIVVVEAALKSGALITSDFALEHGREVFAVPGQVNAPAAQGTNQLIKQGAKLTTSVEDIIEELAPQLLADPVLTVSKPTKLLLREDEQAVWSLFGEEPLDLDELLSRSGFDVTKASQVLLNLEFKNLIRSLPGQRYRKVK